MALLLIPIVLTVSYVALYFISPELPYYFTAIFCGYIGAGSHVLRMVVEGRMELGDMDIPRFLKSNPVVLALRWPILSVQMAGERVRPTTWLFSWLLQAGLALFLQWVAMKLTGHYLIGDIVFGLFLLPIFNKIDSVRKDLIQEKG